MDEQSITKLAEKAGYMKAINEVSLLLLEKMAETSKDSEVQLYSHLFDKLGELEG